MCLKYINLCFNDFTVNHHLLRYVCLLFPDGKNIIALGGCVFCIPTRPRPSTIMNECGTRILFSNHSRWGFFNQFGEFSSLAKFVGGSQEVASPFGSAARYVRTCVYSAVRCLLFAANLTDVKYRLTSSDTPESLQT